MTKIELLPSNGTYYKANLHSHTTVSDGKLTPEESREAYLREGYSIVAYTDHRKYINHTELNTENFLALAGFEMDFNWPNAEPGFTRVKTTHINYYDTDPGKNTQEKEHLAIRDRSHYRPDAQSVNQFTAEMKDLGFIACYNHPYWSLQTYEDYKEFDGFFAMEIYNHGCEREGFYGYNPQSYDEMLRLGKRLGCFATDDNHNSYPFGDPMCDSFGGFTMIHAPALRYADIMESLIQGRYYASTGPLIQEISIEDGELIVRCSPVERIYVMTSGRFCHRTAAPEGETIQEARFPLIGDEGYLRVVCRDSQGFHADSRAYFQEEYEK